MIHGDSAKKGQKSQFSDSGFMNRTQPYYATTPARLQQNIERVDSAAGNNRAASESFKMGLESLALGFES